MLHLNDCLKIISREQMETGRIIQKGFRENYESLHIT